MSIELDVIKGLIKHAISTIASVSAIPVKSPGRTFDIPEDQKYFEIVLIQNNGLLVVPRDWVGAGATWGDEKTFKGILRILLHWPLDDTGIYAQNELLVLIKNLNAKGSYINYGLANLLIYDHPSLSDAILNGHEAIFPLTIPYQCFFVPA